MKLRIITVFVLLLLHGCEAPLNLEGVENEKRKPIYRFDQFQAAQQNKDSTVVVGSYGAVLVSNDKGVNWHRKELASKPPLIDLAVCPDNTFVALDFKGHVWLSQDNGEKWSNKEIGITEVPQAITCDHRGNIWVVGGFSTIYSSSDLGNEWHHTSFDEDFILTSIQFFNAQEGVITGEFGIFMYTTDEGQSWTKGEPIPDEFYPEDALFIDTNKGWVVGLNGKIFHTTDRGNSWQEEKTDTDAPLYGIVIQDHRLFVVGERGTVLFRVPSEKWVTYDYHPTIQSYLRVALPVSSSDLLLAGGAGAMQLIKTSDTPKALVQSEN